MDLREQRGKVIAQTCTIAKKGNLWHVPSQSGNGVYSVNPDRNYCSCPDNAELGVTCKHVHAVRFQLTRSVKDKDGTTTVTTLTVDAKVERKTYGQDWPNYNRAQVNEHRHFQSFLHDLCKSLPAPAAKPGRPPLNPSDAAFTAILKVYSTQSARRFMGDLDESRDNGYISRVPHFNSVLNFFDNESATGILQNFIQRSAAPLAGVETDFAVDSTGFAGARFLKWFDEKYGAPKHKVQWVKLHAMIGVETHVVTSCEVLDKYTSDSNSMPGLVAQTAETFNVRRVCADSAYLGNKNFAAVESVGGEFYPAFKKNTSGGVGGSLAKAYHMFCLNRDEYLTRYHKRSNVESAFSSMKRKFGSDLRSKTDLAMKNEALAKVVCHNLCCVISALYELGIDPNFGCTNTHSAAH